MTAGQPGDCDGRRLRSLVIAGGLVCALLFVVVGVGCELQLYGDGAIFAYAIAVQDAWAFHWHNISGRLFVYLFAHLPAQAFIGLTGSARGGVVVYGLLYFSAPLLGLLATTAVDRSSRRIILAFASASTICLCPLVFGFPTEMWVAHALFWPALALAHTARAGIVLTALLFVLFSAMMLSHGGGVVLAAAMVATTVLPGWRDRKFLRAGGVFLAGLLVLMVTLRVFPADPFIADVIANAAFNFIDPRTLLTPVLLLVGAALAGYAAALWLAGRCTASQPHAAALAVVIAALAVYWLWFDTQLLSETRYYLRTALLYGTPIFGGLAAVSELEAEGQLNLPLPFLPTLTSLLSRSVSARALGGALLLVVLVHTVETAKFVASWAAYKDAVRTLSMGEAADPALGDPKFVSSARIAPKLNRLSWSSTTQFFSVLVSPGLAPKRLVVDPFPVYYWLSCARATANTQAIRAVPTESRRLIQVQACRYR